MPRAKTLRDLFRIRDANRDYLESINGHLGTALGFKRPTGGEVSKEPAILVFVPRKIESKWLPESQLIRKNLEGPDNLTCPLDVVEGGKYEETYLLGFDPYFGDHPLYGWSSLVGDPPLDPDQLVLREQLRGWTDRIRPGSQLAGFTADGDGYYGTLGCFARDRTSDTLGILTNQHVADHLNNVLRFPVHEGRRVAIVDRAVEVLRDEQRLKGLVDEPAAFFRTDCAFAPLLPTVGADEIDPRLPLVKGGKLELQTLGEPLGLDFDTMGPISRKVLGVGRTRSQQRGTIVACAYEWIDDDESHYTDYLIIGEDGTWFSTYGDSGKLIVTEDDFRPVALLWGGWQEKLRQGREQENWTYAIAIDLVTELLDIEIVRSLDGSRARRGSARRGGARKGAGSRKGGARKGAGARRRR